VDLGGLTGAAERIADDPAHGVTGGDGACADKLLAGLKRDVGHLSGRGVDLIERADDEGINLHGVDEAITHRLHPRRFIGLGDALLRIGRFGLRLLSADGLQLAGQRQWLRQLDDLHRPDRIGAEHGGRGIVVVDVRRNELVGAAGKRCRRQHHGDQRRRSIFSVVPHHPISFDQLIALTNTPSGLARSLSALRGCWITMVRMAVQRSVPES